MTEHEQTLVGACAYSVKYQARLQTILLAWNVAITGFVLTMFALRI